MVAAAGSQALEDVAADADLAANVAHISQIALALLAMTFFVTALGACLDHAARLIKLGQPKDRPRGWVIGLLVSSYILLVPGVCMNLFTLQIGAMDWMVTIISISEDMVGFISLLWTSGSLLGATFVVLFALVIPALKLALLVTGGILRHSKDDGRVQCSRRCISFVQKISKWAAPDMFAYILLCHLVRSLSKPPRLNGEMTLDVGFSCFTVFCLGSTISSLGVRTSPAPPVERRPPITKLTAAVLAIIFATFFVILFVHGMNSPVMGLQLDIEALFANGKLPSALKAFVTRMGLGDLASSEVALSDCIVAYWNWMIAGEVNAGLAWMMLAVFVCLFTLFDMIILTAVAINLAVGGEKPRSSLLAIKVCRKLSSLDVFAFGVIVVVLSGSIYKELGVIVSFHYGLWDLIMAEVFHYLSYCTVFLVASDRHAKMPLDDYDLDSKASSDGDTVEEESSEVPSLKEAKRNSSTSSSAAG